MKVFCPVGALLQFQKRLTVLTQQKEWDAYLSKSSPALLVYSRTVEELVPIIISHCMHSKEHCHNSISSVGGCFARPAITFVVGR